MSRDISRVNSEVIDGEEMIVPKRGNNNNNRKNDTGLSPNHRKSVSNVSNISNISNNSNIEEGDEESLQLRKKFVYERYQDYLTEAQRRDFDLVDANRDLLMTTASEGVASAVRGSQHN
jgi:hypothetical protein